MEGTDLKAFAKIDKLLPQAAPLAQLDRASDYESEGREFESLRARQFLSSFDPLIYSHPHPPVFRDIRTTDARPDRAQGV